MTAKSRVTGKHRRWTETRYLMAEFCHSPAIADPIHSGCPQLEEADPLNLKGFGGGSSFHVEGRTPNLQRKKHSAPVSQLLLGLNRRRYVSGAGYNGLWAPQHRQSSSSRRS
jgi:hypothetical protein